MSGFWRKLEEGFLLNHFRSNISKYCPYQLGDVSGVGGGGRGEREVRIQDLQKPTENWEFLLAFPWCNRVNLKQKIKSQPSNYW